MILDPAVTVLLAVSSIRATEAIESHATGGGTGLIGGTGPIGGGGTGPIGGTYPLGGGGGITCGSIDRAWLQ